MPRKAKTPMQHLETAAMSLPQGMVIGLIQQLASLIMNQLTDDTILAYWHKLKAWLTGIEPKSTPED